MKRLFLTGGTGFVGGHLTDSLKDRYVIFHHQRGGDVEENLNRFRPDVVINAAAEVSDESNMKEANELLPSKILNFCERMGGTPLIHFGSSKEDIHPLTPYSLSKRNGSLGLLSRAASQRLPLVVVKPCCIFGERQSPTSFIQKIIDSCFWPSSSVKVGDGAQSYVYIKDVCAAISHLIELPAVQFVGGVCIPFRPAKCYPDSEVYKLVTSSMMGRVIPPPSLKELLPYGLSINFDLRRGLHDMKTKNYE